MTALTEYHWPGNVRELEHFIERAVILSQAPELQPPLAELSPPMPSVSAAARLDLKRTTGEPVAVADLPAEVAAASAGGPPIAGAPGSLPMTGLEAVERDAIRAAILMYHGNLTRVARTLRIAKSTLYLKIERYELNHVLHTVRPSRR
jgi:sigma-54 dependent transcriptional regulator, acetoin dehydrogenase operon transcriptional activator AcoR